MKNDNFIPIDFPGPPKVPFVPPDSIIALGKRSREYWDAFPVPALKKIANDESHRGTIKNRISFAYAGSSSKLKAYNKIKIVMQDHHQNQIK